MIKNETKATGVARQVASKNSRQNNYSKNPAKFRNFDRNLLPTPKEYYAQQFLNLRTNSNNEWLSVLCPFHDDHNPSLSINLISGGFYCHSCGAKGHDILAFQMQRYNQDFEQAAITLGSWRWR